MITDSQESCFFSQPKVKVKRGSFPLCSVLQDEVYLNILSYVLDVALLDSRL